MHILLYKLRIVTIIFHPQLTIQEKSVIMKKKKSVFLFTQAWPTHSSDYLGHEIVTIILIVTKTIMITMSMTKRGQWDWRKAACGDHKWLCFLLMQRLLGQVCLDMAGEKLNSARKNHHFPSLLLLERKYVWQWCVWKVIAELYSQGFKPVLLVYLVTVEI